MKSLSYIVVFMFLFASISIAESADFDYSFDINNFESSFIESGCYWITQVNEVSPADFWLDIEATVYTNYYLNKYSFTTNSISTTPISGYLIDGTKYLNGLILVDTNDHTSNDTFNVICISESNIEVLMSNVNIPDISRCIAYLDGWLYYCIKDTNLIARTNKSGDIELYNNIQYTDDIFALSISKSGVIAFATNSQPIFSREHYNSNVMPASSPVPSCLYICKPNSDLQTITVSDLFVRNSKIESLAWLDNESLLIFTLDYNYEDTTISNHIFRINVHTGEAYFLYSTTPNSRDLGNCFISSCSYISISNRYILNSIMKPFSINPLSKDAEEYIALFDITNKEISLIYQADNIYFGDVYPLINSAYAIIE